MPLTFPRGRGSAALRIGRHSQPGQVYLVTFTTHERRRRFVDFMPASTAARSLHQAGSVRGSRVLAWVLMPDHCRLLVQLGDEETLSRWAGRTKAAMSRALHDLDPEALPVWTKGFHDRALRADDDLLAMARYVVLNPVRAGLVARVGMYPYWDAVWV
jgi:putative transposase